MLIREGIRLARSATADEDSGGRRDRNTRHTIDRKRGEEYSEWLLKINKINFADLHWQNSPSDDDYKIDCNPSLLFI